MLVKHGKPVIEPHRPRSSWRLSQGGRAAATRLAVKLAPLAPTRLFASPEPKAADTAKVLSEALDLTPTIDPGFGEQRADDNAFVSPEAFEANVAAMFAEPDALILGEETGAAARERFDAALARHDLPGADTAIVVAHGRIITLWLTHRLSVEPMSFWRRLGLGCAAILDGDRCDIVEP